LTLSIPDLSGGEISVKTDAYAYGVVVCEILTGLNPMAKPLPVLISDALEEGGLESVLDKKCTWDSEIVHELASIAARCSRVSKLRRKTAQEVLPELEKLYNPNYMPTQLAVGKTYYDPDTGVLTQGGSDEESRRVVHLHAPLLSKHDNDRDDAGSVDAGARQGSTRRWACALVLGIVGIVIGVLLLHRPHRHPSPVSVGGCVGESLTLVRDDCSAWQLTVLPSKYFTTANPPACNDPAHVTDPCSCKDVIGCEGGRITSISLWQNGRTSPLSFNANSDDSLSHLHAVRSLELGNFYNDSDHKLVGSFPSWLQHLASTLTHLNLGGNRLSGPIDALANLTKLENLTLGSNGRLNGTLRFIAQLTSLRYLHLGGNQFTGQLPMTMAKTLVHLTLQHNRLTGSVDAVGRLAVLARLELENNKLSGPIDAVEDLKGLTFLNLRGNQFTGCIDAVSQLTSLTYLNLGGSGFRSGRLNGTIDAVEHLTSLTDLILNDNQFSGSVGAVGMLTNLRFMQLESNHLTGAIDALSTLTTLNYLGLADNRLCGSIEAVAKMKQLNVLWLSTNQFTGSIDPVAQLTLLGDGGDAVRLDNNHFNGTIDAVSKLISLQTLFLGSNKFTGPIDAVAKLRKLRELSLSANQLSGSMGAVASLSSLEYLDLSYNQLNGTLDAVSGLKALTTLRLGLNIFNDTVDALTQLTSLRYLNVNYLHGPIDALANLKQLTHLDMCPSRGQNLPAYQLTGPISALAQLTSLEYVMLGYNRLTGTVDAVKQLTGLTTLDLSPNKLSGTLPTGPIDWNKIGNCHMEGGTEGNHFACPLPAGAITHCSATCDHLACNGTSSGLEDTDCAAWQLTVLPSKYFTTANPSACNDPAHVTDPCSCKDVIGCEGGRITSIDLSNRGLTFNASTDDSLSHLQALRSLSLNGPKNQLVGPLPSWLGKLAGSLTGLLLWSNNFSGPINAVSQLTGLTYLTLAINGFEGPIDAVAALTELTALHLDNTGVSGSIASLAKLTKLTELDLSATQLTGHIDALGTLTSLGFLRLQRAKFTGTIDAVANLGSLADLLLDGNGFSGIVPNGPIDWTKIVNCNIGNNWNHFACPLPAGAITNCKAACQVHSWGELAANVGEVPSGGVGSYLIKGGSFSMDGFQNKTIQPPRDVSIMVTGEGGPVIDASNQGESLFFLHDGTIRLVLQGLTFQCAHGNYRVVMLYGGSLTATDCVFKSNGPSSGQGSAVQVNNYHGDATFVATRCTFVNNSVGVAVDSAGGNITFTQCTWGKPTDDQPSITRAAGEVVFTCPDGTTGAPFVMNSSELRADQLPPTKEVVHCHQPTTIEI
jgi:Leucine-rich repeat (LRR) protein